MQNRESLLDTVRQVNSGKSYPALKLVQSNPEVAALISKLIAPNDKSQFGTGKQEINGSYNQAKIQAISESTKQRIRDNESIVQLFPDIELAIQILVSSILSPKDMVKNDLIYKGKEPILPSELLLKLNTIAQSHIESYHGVQEELQTMLRDPLFTTGSYIKTIIPESIVDEIINQNKAISTESLVELFESVPVSSTDPLKIKNIGILGNKGKPAGNSAAIALEAFFRGNSVPDVESNITIAAEDSKVTDLGIEVTDNFQVLKLPQVLGQMSKQRVRSIIGRSATPSMESIKEKKLTTHEMTQLTYKQRGQGSQTFMNVPGRNNAKRKSVGRPLVMQLPSESVIPVYIPGNESKHIGYFVLIDGEGNPLNRNSADSMMTEGLAALSNSQSQNQSLSSMLIAKAKKNLSSNDEMPSLDQVTKVYASIVENDLMDRLTNGIYGSNVKIGANEEIYRIMLSRSLASKFTRLLYLPAELTTYFAFDYFPNGVGKSYLDGIKTLTSLRAILLFSKVMAQVKSAISLTHVGMTLDPRDPDPQKTIEIAQQEIMKMRQQYFPLGINSSADLVDWIQSAGLEFSFEGHPALPQTKFDFESKNVQRDVPDSELDEALRKQTYMAFGLSPETVDNGFNSEFATTAIQNNILLSKRVTQLQNLFTPKLTDYCRKLLLNDTIAADELKGILKENIGMFEKNMSDEEKAVYNQDQDRYIEDTFVRYIENLEIELPHPDLTTVKSQAEAFGEYSDALDKVLDSWISSEFMTADLVGELNSNIDSIKAVVKAYYLRRWMSENGFMSELNDIVTVTEEGKPTLDIYDVNKNHMEGLIRSSLQFIKSLKPSLIASDKDIEAMGVTAGSSSSSSSDDSSGGSGTDEFGLDTGLDDMSGGDETPPSSDETPEPGSDEVKPSEDVPEDESSKPKDDSSPVV